MKVLILAYDFPPFISVGGLRPYSWYKYFSNNGIYPILITRQFEIKYHNVLDYVNEGYSNEILVEESEKGVIIRTPYRPNLSNRIMLRHGTSRFVVLRKLITAWYEILQWYFMVGTKKELFKAADTFLDRHDVDLIIATGDPFILFKYASVLSKKYGIPWIADYRDPWSQGIKNTRNWVMRWFDSRNEKKIVETASMVITVSETLKTLIGHNIKKPPIKIIPNGFDDIALEKVYRHESTGDKLIIAFSGSVYAWHPWKLVFKAMNDFVKTNHQMKIELRFYGVNEQEKMILFLGENFRSLIDKVHFYARMPNESLHYELTKAHVFLLFNDYSILGTKIFDYLALKRKIIFCFTESEEAKRLKKYFHLNDYQTKDERLQEDLIKKTKSGVIVRNPKHLIEVLGEIFVDFKKLGYVPCESIGVEEYARSRQVAAYAVLVKELIEKGKSEV